MYTLNGDHSDLGIAEQTLKNGDVIVFHYTDDYTSENYEEVSSAEYTEELIDNIGTVTLQSSAAINAARSAYDKLSEEEKENISNYQILLDAEAAYEKLLKELQDNLKGLDDIYASTGKYLVENVTNPTVDSVGGEWTVLGLARAGYDVPKGYMDTYVNNLLKVMKENKGVLHDKKYTEYERVILALTAIGYDVTDVAGYNLLERMADYDKVIWQGTNSAAFALLALDSHEYEIPEAGEGVVQTTRENLIRFMLDTQLDDHGWALDAKTAEKADTDITAMVIQALAPYYGKNVEVTAAINQALVTLSELQDENGFFCDYKGTETIESTAQVIVALTALKINPTTDERFIKNGKSAMDALAAFYTEGGGFSHLLGAGRDGMATEQGYYALVSYYRLLNGQTSLYDMTDVTIKKNEASTPVLPDDSTDETPSGTPEEGETTPSAPSTETGGNAASTGDETPMLFVTAILLLSAAGAVLLFKRKQENAR